VSGCPTTADLTKWGRLARILSVTAGDGELEIVRGV
jgi:hypothetical protein